MNKLSIYDPENNREYVIDVLSDIEISDKVFNVVNDNIMICETNEDHLLMNKKIFNSNLSDHYQPSRVFYKLIEIVENSEKVKSLKEKMFSK